LGLWHVFENTDASCVKSLSIRPLTLFAKFFTCASNPIEERIFLFPIGFCFALGVTIDVGDGDFYVNIGTNTSTDLLFFFS
jgi:hypothetical protein